MVSSHALQTSVSWVSSLSLSMPRILAQLKVNGTDDKHRYLESKMSLRNKVTP
jgi:hypothetical protein